MDKVFDIFLGRVDGWHTRRVSQNATRADVQAWLEKGYHIQTEHQIGLRLTEVYLVA